MCAAPSYEEKSFDAVIDKALLDSLLCGDNATVLQYLAEVCNGKFYLTYLFYFI